MTCAVNGSEKSAQGPRELCKTPHAAEQDGFFSLNLLINGKGAFPIPQVLSSLALPASSGPSRFPPWLLCLLPFLYVTLQYIRSMVAIIRLFLLSMTGPPSWSRDCLDAVARTAGWVEQHRRSKVYGDGNRAIDSP